MSLVHGGMNAASQHSFSCLKTVGRALGLAALCTLPLAAYLVSAGDGAPAPSARDAPVSPPQRQPEAGSLRYLDLETPRGSRAAYAHLRAAARRVCEQMQDGDGIGSRTPFSTCVHEALREALGTSALQGGLDGPSE